MNDKKSETKDIFGNATTNRETLKEQFGANPLLGVRHQGADMA